MRLDMRLGARTLSSLALPILEAGSLCSRNMLKRADNLGMMRLVRKSSSEGKAREKSIVGGGGTSGVCSWDFLLFLDLKLLLNERAEGDSGVAARSCLSLFLDFLFLRKRFIVGIVRE